MTIQIILSIALEVSEEAVWLEVNLTRFSVSLYCSIYNLGPAITNLYHREAIRLREPKTIVMGRNSLGPSMNLVTLLLKARIGSLWDWV